jgi:hypothetical protein
MAGEQTIRLAFFLGVLTIVAVWEFIAPRRTLTDCLYSYNHPLLHTDVREDKLNLSCMEDGKSSSLPPLPVPDYAECCILQHLCWLDRCRVAILTVAPTG